MYKVGQILLNKRYTTKYCLVTKVIPIEEGSLKGHYQYRYVILEECIYPEYLVFYSFEDNNTDFSLASDVPKEIIHIAMNYCLENIEKWTNICKGIKL